MRPAPQYLLPIFAALTALAVAVAFGFPAASVLPAARWHAIFAVGALPMILLAMGYFVPVLTRSGASPRLLAAAPLAALVAGLAIVGHFLHPQPLSRLAAPWLALAAIAGFAHWLARRWRRCLGRPNPCLAWYAAALALLALGLLAVALMPWLPQAARGLRLFHLHLNTLGFMGLTALGTMQVLLPTIANRHDPLAMPRLASDLKWAVGGALLLAVGAAVAPVLALIGAGVYAWPWLHFAIAAGRHYGSDARTQGNTAALLFAATAGLALAGAHGVVHALALMPGADAVAIFVLAFLLPLVSGAAGQLLPVWLQPGQQGDWHRVVRERLAGGARFRAGLLLAAGLLAFAGREEAAWLGLIAAIWLVAGMLSGVLSKRN